MGNSLQFESRYALNLEIIAGCTPMPDYPDFWRADISIKRLQQAAARYASFIFVFVKENTKFENAVNCFIHDVEYAMNQLKISDGPGTTKNEIFG